MMTRNSQNQALFMRARGALEDLCCASLMDGSTFSMILYSDRKICQSYSPVLNILIQASPVVNDVFLAVFPQQAVNDEHYC
jgi:hypothetical protein